jgi:hypothetical protein
VAFDTKGLRTQFYLDALELQQTGWEPVGEWDFNQDCITCFNMGIIKVSFPEFPASVSREIPGN